MKPARASIAAALLWTALGGLVSAGLLTIGMWWLAGAMLLAMAVMDALLLWQRPRITVERIMPGNLALGRLSRVTLRLNVAGESHRRIRLHDHHPGDWPVVGLPVTLRLEPGREFECSYQLRPIERGEAMFKECEVREWSGLHFWTRRYFGAESNQVKVYPNFAPLARFALLNAERASRVIGAHLQRKRGEGTEFHQLREYRVGDSLRQVDWKATARMRRPISREYQEEQNQNVVVLLDNGRRMLAKDSELSHFDHALNAVLLLGYLVVRQGDSIGVQTTRAPMRWLLPQRGEVAIQSMLDCLYDVEAHAVATDYIAAATRFASQQRRRSLVVLVTNLRDDDIDDLLPAVHMLQRQHLVCVASLREQVLDDALAAGAAGGQATLTASGAAMLMLAREQAHVRLKRSGVMVLDVTADQLPGALSDAYLSIKRSGRL